MTRHPCTAPIAASIVLLAICRPTGQGAVQTPTAESLKRTVLDLNYRVVDLKSGTTDVSGGGSALSGKMEPLALKETATEIRIELAADVLFDFDKAEIKPQAAETLSKAAAVLRDRARGPVRIDGYTDAKGSDAYNQKLSLRRAEAVRVWFVEREGLKQLIFNTRGLGAKNPVAPNTHPNGSDDPDGRQKNRRVEIIAGKG